MQAPTLSSSSRLYGIVGNGRLATHVAHYFTLLDVPFRQWSRANAGLTGADESQSLHDAMHDCTHVLVLISDGAIESFIEKHSFLRSKTLVHCSGSLVTGLADGYHPLFSFSHTLHDLATYTSIAVVCDAGRPTFAEVFPSLPNPWTTLEPSLKPYYHALCVLSGNFTTLVWQKVFKEFESRLAVPHEYASSYLESIVGNLLEYPVDALTGPLARNDTATIERNLGALKDDPFVHIYAAMLEVVGSAEGRR